MSSINNTFRAQFVRRELVATSNPVKQHDAILIICTITSTPTPPALPPTIQRKAVPRDLLDAMGSLLDEWVLWYYVSSA